MLRSLLLCSHLQSAAAACSKRDTATYAQSAVLQLLVGVLACCCCAQHAADNAKQLINRRYKLGVTRIPLGIAASALRRQAYLALLQLVHPPAAVDRSVAAVAAAAAGTAASGAAAAAAVCVVSAPDPNGCACSMGPLPSRSSPVPTAAAAPSCQCPAIMKISSKRNVIDSCNVVWCGLARRAGCVCCWCCCCCALLL